MKRLIAIAALAAVVVLAGGASAARAPFVGVWKGTVKAQTGETYALLLTLGPKVKSANAGTISYAGTLKCSGKLAYLKSSGRVLTLRETVKSGACARGGSVVVMQQDFRTLYFEWYGQAATEPTLTGFLALGGR